MKTTIRVFSFLAFVSVLFCSLFQVPVKAEETSKDFFLSAGDRQILEQYKAGDLESAQELRKQICEENNLENFVDENYFLNETFYTTYSPQFVMYGRLMLLDRYQTPAYQQKLQEMLVPQEMISPRAMSVIDLTYVSAFWGSGQINNGLWRLSNQALAFCANGMYASPGIGTQTSDPYIVDNAAARKSLYYGFNGPENIMAAKGYTNEQMIVATNDFVSYALTGKSVGSQAANGYHWNGWIKQLYDEIQSKPDPKDKNYAVYMVDTSGNGVNWAGQTTPLQPLVYGQYVPKGELQIRKTTANSSISSNNPNYSLIGAQYGLFTDNKATNQIGTFTIQSDLSSNILSNLDVRTYYIKETKAPQGFALDPTIHKVDVKQNERVVLTCSDMPRSNPIDLILQKVDHDTNSGTPINQPSLENAQFTIKYYTQIQGELKDPARTWVFKSDAQGKVFMNDTYKISGDELFKNMQGQVVIPIGTITIQETKAPNGYVLDPTIHSQIISDNGTAETISAFQTMTIPNKVNRLLLQKKQLNTDILIPGTVFIHTTPGGTRHEITTNEEGWFQWAGLENGIHTLKEKHVMPGYEMDQNEIRFEVSETGIRLLEGNQAALQNDTLIVCNDLIKPTIEVLKQNDSNQVLQGAQFSVYTDREGTKCIETVTTDEHGKAKLTSLEAGKTYYLKETKAPNGYRLPTDEMYEIRIESVPANDIFDVYINGAKDHEIVSIEEEAGMKKAMLTIINHARSKLPETGSKAAVWMTIIGTTVAMIAYIRQRKGK